MLVGGDRGLNGGGVCSSMGYMWYNIAFSVRGKWEVLDKIIGGWRVGCYGTGFVKHIMLRYKNLLVERSRDRYPDVENGAQER